LFFVISLDMLLVVVEKKVFTVRWTPSFGEFIVWNQCFRQLLYFCIYRTFHYSSYIHEQFNCELKYLWVCISMFPKLPSSGGALKIIFYIPRDPPEFFTTFRTSHLFIPRFLAESVMTSWNPGLQTLVHVWFEFIFYEEAWARPSSKGTRAYLQSRPWEILRIIRELNYIRQIKCETRALFWLLQGNNYINFFAWRLWAQILLI
jgi:hypothetical protein